MQHEHFCRLSRAFNQVANLSTSQDSHINEWLKAQISASQNSRMCFCPECGRSHVRLGFKMPATSNYAAMLSELKAALAFLEDEVGYLEGGREGSFNSAARALSDRIAAVIKMAEGEV